MTEQNNTFEPGRHLSLVNGNEYLEVKWRLVWFRSIYPTGHISTELVSHANGVAVFKATVKTSPEVVANRDTGELTTVFPGISTGHGMEDAQGFGDYLEKAETKAIGRALGGLGFGTQFSRDYDLDGRVVDAPVQQAQQASPAPAPQQQYTPQPQPQQYQQQGQQQPRQPFNGQFANPTAAPTDKQKSLAAIQWRNRTNDGDDSNQSKDAWLRHYWGKGWNDLNREEMSKFIDTVKEPNFTSELSPI